MKKKMLTTLQLLLLAGSMAFVGASLAPAEAQASSECQIKCNGGNFQCGVGQDCSWSCT